MTNITVQSFISIITVRGETVLYRALYVFASMFNTRIFLRFEEDDAKILFYVFIVDIYSLP
jgi:hypothetical protein